MISLLVTLLTAAILFAVWQFWQDEEPPPVYQRGLSDVYLDWKCEAGHIFRMRGQAEPRTCTICGRRAYPIIRFTCPQHGDMEVSVRYAIDENRVAHPSAFRVDSGTWVPADEPLRCPRCNRVLIPKPKDPFEGQPGEARPGDR
jgi:hypothetical protein